MIAQIFILTAELRIPTGIATNDANAEIEMQLVTSKLLKNRITFSFMIEIINIVDIV